MKIKKWLSLLLFIISTTYGSTRPIHSIQEISSYIDDRAHILVVFDIDDTLTILSDPAFHRPNFKTHHAAAFKEIMAPLNIQEQALAFTMPHLMTHSDLIEQETPLLIEEMQKQGIKTIALTATMGIEINNLSIEDRRIVELKRVGINFSTSFPEMTEITLPGFETPLLGRSPFYKNGVIFTNENEKGKVLVEFLKNISWKPHLVLFIDDRIEHVHSVQNALNNTFPEIDFIGFHFQPTLVPYETTDTHHFSTKWTEVAEKAKQESGTGLIK